MVYINMKKIAKKKQQINSFFSFNLYFKRYNFKCFSVLIFTYYFLRLRIASMLIFNPNIEPQKPTRNKIELRIKINNALLLNLPPFFSI